MRKQSELLGVVFASLLGVILLWVADEQLRNTVQTNTPWPALLASIATLGAGVSAGSAFAIGGIRSGGAYRLLLAGAPFGLLLLYQWYWLSGWLSLGGSSALGRFLVSEPAFIGAPAVTGVALGLAIWPRRFGGAEGRTADGVESGA